VPEAKYRYAKTYKPYFGAAPAPKQPGLFERRWNARSNKKLATVSKSKKKEVAGSVVGAGVGQGAYQAAGYGPKWVIRSNTRFGDAHNKRLSQIKDPTLKARKKSWEAAKKTQAKRGLSASTDPQFWRSLPKSTYGSKVLRTTGWTHSGKTGMATGAAVTSIGALAGSSYARRKHGS